MNLHQREPIFEYFKIIGLHNERNLTLRMDSNVKVLVGDNGSGKTTLLNCLHYILTKNYDKLENICFEKIELKFSSGDTIHISKSQIFSLKSIGLILDRESQEIVSVLGLSKTKEFIRYSKKYTFNMFSSLVRRSSISNKLSFYSVREIYDAIRRVGTALDNQGELFPSEHENWSKIIDKNLDLQILYLPTYRRIEEDLKNLGAIDDDFDDSLINFGMNDVKGRFDRIRDELRESAVSLYTNLNGRMLTQLTTDYQATSQQFQNIQNTSALKIVLGRVGDSISPTIKSRIITLVEQGTIEQEKYHPLVFVLSNLIDVYYEQKQLDDAIKEFAIVANKYLVNKSFVYDESKVEVKIVNKRTNTPVELENLSSGEKQLVSILSKLYLDTGPGYAILFDEPELSLSMEWQIELLPDILSSSRCGFLLAATHSPFIFQNELDALTDSICVDYNWEATRG
ncbi:AAA family ATPase [Vibrio parahaemolyticus]|nr:AAA family ATPase [Vibrio parahaemolyticus]